MTTPTLLPCPVPSCQSIKVHRSNNFVDRYIYCSDCMIRGPRESEDDYGARWNSITRTSGIAGVPAQELDTARPTEQDTCKQCGCTHASAYELGRSDERVGAEGQFRAGIEAAAKVAHELALVAARQGEQGLRNGDPCYQHKATMAVEIETKIRALTPPPLVQPDNDDEWCYARGEPGMRTSGE